MTLGDLVVELKLKASEFLSGIDNVVNRVNSMQGQFIAAGAALTAGITVPLVGLGQSALAMGTQMEQAAKGFTTMLGSGQEAEAFLQDLKDFAAATPFEFPDLLTASKRLLAMGFAAHDVVPMMTAVGDAVAGLGGGAEMINRITLALGQMHAKGKVSAEEMRQLAESGIPAWEMLANKIGKSIPEAMKMAEKGAISAAEAIPAIIAGMNDRFGGMMESFSKTAAGQWSNLKDSISYVLADIGKSLLPLASAMLENFLIPAGQKLKEFAEWFSKLPDPIKAVSIAFAALAASIGPVLLALAGFSATMTAIAGLLGTAGITATLGALLPILGAVAAAIAAVAAAWALWQLGPVHDAVIQVWDALKGFGETLKPFVADFAAWSQSLFTVGRELVGGTLLDGLKILGSLLKEVAVVLIDFGKTLASAPGWLQGVAAAFAGLFLATKTLPVVFTEMVGGFKLLASGVQTATAVFPALIGNVTAFIALAREFGVMQAFSAAFPALGVAVTGAKVAITALIAEMTTFIALSKEFGAVQALSAAFPTLTNSINGAMTAMGGLPGILSKIEGAVALTAAAFAAWQLGSWAYQHIPAVKALGDAIAGLVLQIPGIERLINVIGGVPQANKAFADSVEMLEKKLKEKGVTVDRAGLSLELYAEKLRAAALAYTPLHDALGKSKLALDEASKSFEELKKQYHDGQVKAQEYLAAQAKLTDAQAAYSSELKKIQERMGELRKAYADAKKNFDEVEKAQQSGAKSAAQLDEANGKLVAAEKALNAEIASARRASKEYGIDLRELTTAKVAAVAKTKTLAETEKDLKEAVKNAEIEYKNLVRQFNEGKASSEAVEKAYIKLRAAQDKLDPEGIAKRQGKANEEMMKRYDEIIAAETKLILSNQEVEKSWAALEVKLTGTRLGGQVPEDIQRVIDASKKLEVELYQSIEADLKEIGKINDAYKQVGLQTPAELAKVVAANKAAWETISNDSGTNSVAALQAWVRYEQSRQEQVRMSGGVITQSEKDELEKRQRDLDIALGKQKSTYEQWRDDIKGIFANLSTGLSAGLVQLLEGKFSDAWTTFKNAGVAALEDIAQSVLKLVTDYLVGKLQKAFLDLIDDILPSLAKWFGKLIGLSSDFASSLASSVSSIGNNQWWSGVQSAGGVGGTAGGAGGAAGGAGGATSGAASGVWGIVGAVGSIGTMVSSIIGNFQMAGMNKSLDLIEASTRFTAIAMIGPKGVIEILWALNDVLWHIDTMLWNIMNPAIEQIRDATLDLSYKIGGIAGLGGSVDAIGATLATGQTHWDLQWISSVCDNGAFMITDKLTEIKGLLESGGSTPRTATFNITQLPGESAEAMANRVANMLRTAGVIV